MPDPICELNARVVAVEVQQENDSDMIKTINDNQVKLIEKLDLKLTREESIRWRVASSTVGLLVAICIGLISFIYTGGIP